MRQRLIFLAGQYNERSGFGTSPEMFQMVVVEGGKMECASSLPSHYHSDRDQTLTDWAHAQDVAVDLSQLPDCRTIMDPRLRHHPSVEAGARAVSVPGLAIGICGSEDPNACEAIGLAILSGRGLLLESGLQEIARISGNDPRKVLPFSWAPE